MRRTEQAQCSECGAPFQRGLVGWRRRQTCSKVCLRKRRQRIQRERRRSRRPISPANALCEACGAVFEVPRNRPTQKSCGGECARKRYEQRRRRYSTLSVECAWCGVRFITRRTRKKLCSRRCAHADFRRRRAASGRPVGKGRSRAKRRKTPRFMASRAAISRRHYARNREQCLEARWRRFIRARWGSVVDDPIVFACLLALRRIRREVGLTTW
jgi:hypothetical protein